MLIVAGIFDWDWVALGTLALAIATFALAWQNRVLVKTSREEMAATRESLDLGHRQADAAEATLEAQTRPLLTSFPLSLEMEPDKIDAMTHEVVSHRDAGTISMFMVGDEGWIDVPFRNVGNGLALIREVWFQLRDGGSAGVAGNPALPPAERTTAHLDYVAASSWASEVFERHDDFSVIVIYTDLAGENQRATRLDIHWTGGPRPMYVRQVHFGITYDGVRDHPDASSSALN